MPQYVYKVATQSGRVMTQAAEATSETEMRERLLADGYYVYSVRPKGGSLLNRRIGSKKIHPDDILILTQQLHTLNRSGLALAKSLELLTHQTHTPALRELLADVCRRVQAGELVSEAFEATGDVPLMFTAALRAGERSGNLDKTLSDSLSYQKVSRTLKHELLSAMIYPIILIVALVILVFVAIVWVVPNFARLYGELNIEMPVFTQIVIGVALSLKATAQWILLGLVAAVFGVLAWRRTPSGQMALDRLKYRLPMVGEILHIFSIAQYSRTLAILLGGGIPIIPALETSRKSIDSPILSSAVSNVQSEVQKGRSLADSLRTSPFFPVFVTNMVEVGEATGALVPMLNGAADFYQEEGDTRLSRFITLIGPLMLILMAIVVLVILVAFYLPLFTIMMSRVG